MKNQRKAAAYAIFLEEKMTEVYNVLVEGICSNFEMLANTNPELALSVLNQLNDQLDEEEVNSLRESIDENLEKVANMITLGE